MLHEVIMKFLTKDYITLFFCFTAVAIYLYIEDKTEPPNNLKKIDRSEYSFISLIFRIKYRELYHLKIVEDNANPINYKLILRIDRGKYGSLSHETY